MLDVYIGYDARERDAYTVCKSSIMRRSTISLSVQSLMIQPLVDKGLYTRTWHMEEGVIVDDIDGKPFSTEFAFTRFLVPYLNDYQGWALFCDCDFLFIDDVANLAALADDRYAVMVVKHDHVPSQTVKMDGIPQTIYRRKNWSSLILWNCGHRANAKLTPREVNSWPGSRLHAFDWLDDSLIGEIGQEWNYLVGYTTSSKPPRALHFTDGGPWFPDHADGPYADLWMEEYSRVYHGRDDLQS